MKDIIKLDSVPVFEGSTTEAVKSLGSKLITIEPKMYKKQLNERFADKPEGCKFVLTTSSINFGEYAYEVGIQFNSENDEEVEYATELKEQLPEYWNVGFYIPISLRDFAQGDIESKFIEKFGNNQEIVYYIKIYTRDEHLDLWLDVDLFDKKIQQTIEEKDIAKMLKILSTIDKGAYFIHREFNRNPRKADYYNHEIMLIVDAYADMDEVNDEIAIQELFDKEKRKVAKLLAEYPENATIRVCPKCGLPLRYNSIGYEEGFHFDTCY